MMIYHGPDDGYCIINCNLGGAEKTGRASDSVFRIRNEPNIHEIRKSRIPFIWILWKSEDPMLLVKARKLKFTGKHYVYRTWLNGEMDANEEFAVFFVFGILVFNRKCE